MVGYKNISIPVPLYDRLESMAKENNFKNIRAFIIHLIRETVSRYNAEKDGIFFLTDNDEEKIKKRLKELGYMD